MRAEIEEFIKILAVAFAVGLDVFAISVGVGIAKLAWSTSLRLGFVFAFSEIVMQATGFALGAGAGRMFGAIAAWTGLAILALVGGLMIRSSLAGGADSQFSATRGTGLVMTALSVSLDSLGVGIALPAVAIPLVPLLIVVSISTTLFTLGGLAFGARLGERFEHRAQLAAGAMLLLLAILFAMERIA